MGIDQRERDEQASTAPAQAILAIRVALRFNPMTASCPADTRKTGINSTINSYHTDSPVGAEGRLPTHQERVQFYLLA